MGAVAELAIDAEHIAGLGHNRPPEPASAYEACKIHIEDLWTEAKNWADGTPVENQAQADEVSRLIEEFRLAHVAADNARKAENEVFDKGKAAVQEKYAPLIADTKAVTGKTIKAQAALKAALKPYLDKLEAVKRAVEVKAREEAEAAAALAAAAMRKVADNDLEAREAAEELVEAARLASTAASRACNDKAHARGGSRAMGLRKTYTASVHDPRALLLHYWGGNGQPGVNREPIVACLQQMAQQDVDRKVHTIPGVTVVEGTTL